VRETFNDFLDQLNTYSGKSLADLGVFLSKFLTKLTGVPRTAHAGNTDKRLVDLEKLPQNLFDMAKASSSSAGDSIGAGHARVLTADDLERDIADQYPGHFASLGNKGNVLMKRVTRSQTQTAKPPSAGADAAATTIVRTPLGAQAAARSDSRPAPQIMNIDFTKGLDSDLHDLLNKLPRRVNAKDTVVKSARVRMRSMKFGLEEAFAAVPVSKAVQVDTTTIGEKGPQLSSDVASVCNTLNLMCKILYQIGIDEMRTAFTEAVMQKVMQTLQGLLVRGIFPDNSVRVIDINKRNEEDLSEFKVPTLVLELSDGTWVVGHGDLTALKLVGGVEFCCLATEMKPIVSAQYLGQLASEIMAFDSLQTPGNPRQVSDIVAQGAHMCSGVLSNGLGAVGLTVLTPDDVEGVADICSTTRGDAQTLFFVEVAGFPLGEETDKSLVFDHNVNKFGTFHLIALHLVRMEARLKGYDQVADGADGVPKLGSFTSGSDAGSDNGADDPEDESGDLTDSSAPAASGGAANPEPEGTNPPAPGSHHQDKKNKRAPLSSVSPNVWLGGNPSGWRGVPAGAVGSHSDRVLAWSSRVEPP